MVPNIVLTKIVFTLILENTILLSLLIILAGTMVS